MKVVQETHRVHYKLHIYVFIIVCLYSIRTYIFLQMNIIFYSIILCAIYEYFYYINNRFMEYGSCRANGKQLGPKGGWGRLKKTIFYSFNYLCQLLWTFLTQQNNQNISTLSVIFCYRISVLVLFLNLFPLIMQKGRGSMKMNKREYPILHLDKNQQCFYCCFKCIICVISMIWYMS